MADMQTLPTRAEFIRDRLADAADDLAQYGDLGDVATWWPEPTDTGVMHGPWSGRTWRKEAPFFHGWARHEWPELNDPMARWDDSDEMEPAYRIPGTTRTV